MDLLALVPQDPISAILTAGALLIAFVTLWLSYFRGPSIGVVNSATAEVARLQAPNPAVPDYTELKQFALVLVNNGSRSGVVTNVDITFQPAPPFAFFSIKVEPVNPPSLVIGSTDQTMGTYTQQSLPLSIPSGDSKVLQVGARIIFGNWKDLEGLKDIPQDGVGDSVRRLFDAQRKRLSDLVRAVETEEILGSISVLLTVTKRRRFRTSLTPVRVLGPLTITISPAVKKEFASYEGRFDSSLPRPSELVRDLSNVTGAIIDELSRNAELLGKQIAPQDGPFTGPAYNALQSWVWVQSYTRPLIRYRSPFEPIFRDHVWALEEYDSKVQALRATRTSAVEASTLRDLNEERELLGAKSEEILTEFSAWVNKSLRELQQL